MTPDPVVDAYEAELEKRVLERMRLDDEAHAAARASFLAERIAAMPKGQRPTDEDAADLQRRLLDVHANFDRYAVLGAPGTVSIASFSVAALGTGEPFPWRDAPHWAEEVDRLAAKKTPRGRMVRAEIEAACAEVAKRGGAASTLRTMRDLVQLPASALPPGVFARIVLALAWPKVHTEWQRARAERGLRRGPLAPSLMRTLGRKVPLEKGGGNKAGVYPASGGVPSRVRVECAAGSFDLFHPAVVEQGGKGAADAFRAMAKVLGPRTIRTLWTCLDAVQRREPEIRRSGGDFLYTPGAFADAQRPRREKVGRHDAAIIAALDEDMRRLAQTSVEWTVKAGTKDWTIKANLVVFQHATLTQGKKAASLPVDQFGPTREKRAKGRRPAELWRINPTILEMMQTAGAFLVWDPAVLRTSPEAVALYLDLVAYARFNPHDKEQTRLVESIVRDTGIVRPDPHAPTRLRTRLDTLLGELKGAGVLFGRLDVDRVVYTLPERHAAALDAIPAKRLPPEGTPSTRPRGSKGG